MAIKREEITDCSNDIRIWLLVKEITEMINHNQSQYVMMRTAVNLRGSHDTYTVVYMHAGGESICSSVLVVCMCVFY